MHNLNNELHFAQNPLDVNIERSTFDRSSGYKTTSVAGYLNVNYVDEILPGDTVDMKVSQLTRMTTPVFPVVDDCWIDQYFFFVPMRLVWDGTREFFGENRTTEFTNPVVKVIPKLRIDNITRDPQDYAHQMGLPMVTAASGMQCSVNALPLRSLRLIWNDWFRNQNVQRPELLVTTDNETDTTLVTKKLPVTRAKDYFGTALPGTQKGSAVKVAMSGMIPVVPSGNNFNQASDFAKPGSAINYINVPMTWRDVNIMSPSYSRHTTSGQLGIIGGGNTGVNTTTVSGSLVAPELMVDFGLPGSQIGIDVNELRYAVQAQRVLERLCRSGSRYTEFVRSMFGIVSPDARQQRPELLGSERWHIQMQEIGQTSATGTTGTPIGTVGASSKTVGAGCAFSKSFTEHGYLIGVYCIRHNRTYCQGINRMWTRTNMLDFYLPALAHIGEQPIEQREIYAASSTPVTPFGFQEAWAEYRYKPSLATGLLDPTVTGTLGTAWTYTDKYTSAPTLSSTWIEEGHSEIDSTLALSGQDQFIHDFWFDAKYTRCMPVYSVPGLVDHF